MLLCVTGSNLESESEREVSIYNIDLLSLILISIVHLKVEVDLLATVLPFFRFFFFCVDFVGSISSAGI